MIPYNEMISLINIIYGQQNSGHQTPVQTMPVQQTPVQTMAAYTPVLPLQTEAIKAENDVLKDVIATLQRNAMAQPISGYSPETSDTILSNLINPPIPAK